MAETKQFQVPVQIQAMPSQDGEHLIVTTSVGPLADHKMIPRAMARAYRDAVVEGVRLLEDRRVVLTGPQGLPDPLAPQKPTNGAAEVPK